MEAAGEFLSAHPQPMRVLVIGAGAIGQVFGYFFAKGGADVTFLMRPRQESDAQDGLILYPMNRPSTERSQPVHFKDFHIETDLADALNSPWDVVVLAMGSLSLRSGHWLSQLTASLGSAQVLSLLPGSDDPQYVLQHLPAERVSFGLLAVMSFQAPLQGQNLPRPGVAFYFPWRASLAFSGADPSTSRIIDTLAAGGMPTHRTDHVPSEIAFSGPILAHIISGLECSGFELHALRRDRALLQEVVATLRETWMLAARVHGQPVPLGLRLLRPWHVRLLLWAAPRHTPFDLQRFFEFHYRKVGEQHLVHLQKLVQACELHAVPNPSMRSLLSRLEGVRA